MKITLYVSTFSNDFSDMVGDTWHFCTFYINFSLILIKCPKISGTEKQTLCNPTDTFGVSHDLN